MSRYRDVPYTTRRGGLRMVAALRGVSSAAKAHETTLSSLYESPVERLPWKVELLHHLAVHLDSALGDHSPRFARGADRQVLDEHSREMDGLGGGQDGLLDVLGSLAFADHAREVVLGLLGRLLPMRAVHDE